MSSDKAPPPVDWSALSLFPATPAQIIQARKRTHQEWGKGLTLEEHLERDAAQDLLQGSQDGRLTVWVLAPRDDPGTLDFKCACETFKRTGLVRGPGEPSARAVACYGIASVFTPPEHRGRGFARHMMRLLHWAIADPALLPAAAFPRAEWGAPPAVDAARWRDGWASALWSDVGDFYARCGPVPGVQGWVITGTRTTVWEVRHAESQPTTTTTEAIGWAPLDGAAVLRLWEHDSESIRRDVELDADVDRPVFTFLPREGVASFQHRRLDHFLDRLPVRPVTWGLASADKTAYATWTIDPRPPHPKTLTITRLRVSVDLFDELVEQVFAVAREYEVERVEVWNLDDQLVDHVKGARTFERSEHLPAIKWYGPESESDVTWTFNQRFCWC